MAVLPPEDIVTTDLRRQDEMERTRAPYEAAWREVDDWIDPELAGGFSGQQGYVDRSAAQFDATATEGLDRFTAGIAGLTIPDGSRWHGIIPTDKDLNRDPAVRRWCEHATDRLFACRYNPWAGFAMQAHADIRQTGKYGTAPLWIDEQAGVGLYYRALHLSEVFIAEDFRGRVDTVHRKFELTARQAAQMFGTEALPDKIVRSVMDDGGAKAVDKFPFLHVVCPRADWEPGHPGHKGMPYASRYISIEGRQVVRSGGYRSMPIAVSRNMVSPGQVYGRSPAMKVLGHVKTLHSMAMTMLRSAHKQVDPALAFFDDGDIGKLVTRPGGLNPGLVDEFGRLLVAPIPHGGNLSEGMAMQEAERQPVKDAFLEQLFQILTEPSDRMTATQVLETIQKQGVLVAPFTSRHETEKLAPMIARELDILERAGQIDPRPPVMREAGAGALVVYENPLARMKRAEEAAGFTRWVEVAVQIAGAMQSPEVFDYIRTDQAMPGLADVLSVRPTWVATPDEVAAKREARSEQAAMAQATVALPDAAGAALDLAKANQIGGGL